MLNAEEKSLSGRTALVTGGALRIGRACVLALAEAGADVVVHYHNSHDEACHTADQAAVHGVRAVTAGGDLRSEKAVRDLFTEACTLSGGIDILVNSASIFPESSIRDFAWDELEENMRLHGWAPLLLSRLFAAQTRFAGLDDPPAEDRLGNIVNLLDSRIADYDRRHAAYHLSRRLLFDTTRMLSLELAPAVKVNAIAPGLILPPAGAGNEYLEQLRTTNPLQRAGTPADITSALLFFISNSFVTGQVLFIDGGRRMKGSMYGA